MHTCHSANCVWVHFWGEGFHQLHDKLVSQLDALVGDDLDGDQLARAFEDFSQLSLQKEKY